MYMEKEKEKINYKLVIFCFCRSCKLLFQTDFVRIIIIILLTIIAGFLPSISTVTMQIIVNSVQQANNTISYLISYIILYASIDIFNGLLAKLVAYQSFTVEKESSIKISLLILEKTKKLELSDYENMNTYDMLQRAQNEINGRLFNYFTSYLTILQSFITIISNFFIINRWNMWVILILAFITIIRTMYLIWVGKKKYSILRKRTTKERKKWYYQFLLTNDIAFKEIKIYDLYNHFINKFKEISFDFFEQDRKINRNQNFFDAIFTLADAIISGIIFGFLIISSKLGRILIGDAMAYTRSISNIKNNIESFCLQIVAIWENTLYISQLFELLDIKKNKEISKENMVKIEKVEKIELINVSYRYESSNKYVLKDINIVLDNNELFFLVGKNGSGKSTLVKLISGYYEDYEGIILINGIDFKSINKEYYRKKIGILLQDFMKYEFTIRENVTLSNLIHYSDDDKINNILKSIGFTNYETIDTQLGYWFENGYQLSGGEWLKIALGRAFNRNAEIYILDEPNAALDPIAETEILQHFNQLVYHNIGIIVTHRISSIIKGNGKIIVMDNGRIIDIGNHNELYLACQLYKELFIASRREEVYEEV